MDPTTYEQTGGLFAMLETNLQTFMTNPVHENLVLASILGFICS